MTSPSTSRRTRSLLAKSVSILAAVTLVASACGKSDSANRLTLTSDPANENDEPDVEIPKEIPTELVISDITEGSGEGAVDGDTVYVHYVGVLSKDGTRFDGNFGSDPFPVTLGLGMVIPGWDQGLVGAKVGGRRQLDIPSNLAYGEEGAGDTIGPNEALSFVIDVVAIVPMIDAAGAPTDELEPREPVEKVASEDLVEGTGDEADEGDTVVVHLVAYRADTGERLESTWESPQPLNLSLVTGATLEGFLDGIPGMKVGGRRQIVLPYAQAFGEAGNTDLGLPEKTDLVVIIDLFAIL